jgi:hypothetical protein
VRIPSHAHHLDHDLELTAAFVLHPGKTYEIIANPFELGPFAIRLEGLFARAVEAQRDVFQRRLEQLFRGGFIEQRSVCRNE